MIIETTLILAGIAAMGSIYNALPKKKRKHFSIKKYTPGGLTVITLTNNNKALNFMIDTGSNISHICANVMSDIVVDSTQDKVTNVKGINGDSLINKQCTIPFKDTLGDKYNIDLYVSKQLENSAKYIEENTGVPIHGLLGTDFLQKYKYVIDYNSLEIYTSDN